jgi:putative transposase
MTSRTDDEKRKNEIATFRFGLIAEFVTGVLFTRGEKERLLRQKAERRYTIPGSGRTRVARETILKWIRDYERGGKELCVLSPKTRADKGRYRSLSPAIRLTVKEILKESPGAGVPALIRELKHRKVIPPEMEINRATLYRYLNTEKLRLVNDDADDRRRFETQSPNEIWQSDVMHGPYVTVDGKKRKAYLLAFLDDHSRFIVFARFALNETFETFRRGLQGAIERHGLPQKLYVDNGSCFRSVQLEHTLALLGVALSHSRPYTPQGRGKLERWFRTVRDQFLAIALPAAITLAELNERFETWLDQYQRALHGTTRQAPRERYFDHLQCVRPAPSRLSEYFRTVLHRRVKKDRSFRLRGRMFEAPVALIDRSIELRFHEESPSQVEIYFEAMSFGQAALLDPHVNAKLGRNWMTREKKRSEPDRGPSPDAGLPVLKSGTLPLGSSSSISSQGDES